MQGSTSYLDMPALTTKTINTHVNAVVDARVAVTDTGKAGAARTARDVHKLLRLGGGTSRFTVLTLRCERAGHRLPRHVPVPP